MAETQYSPYTKQNCTWPVRTGSKGWQREKLAKRFEAAVKHLVRTPKGSLYMDPEYGTELYKLRTQTVSDDEVGVQRPFLAQQFARYLPDLILTDLQISMDHEHEKLTISVYWIIRGAERAMHGDLADPKKTTVMM